MEVKMLIVDEKEKEKENEKEKVKEKQKDISHEKIKKKRGRPKKVIPVIHTEEDDDIFLIF
jgi:hypothetical protein